MALSRTNRKQIIFAVLILILGTVIVSGVVLWNQLRLQEAGKSAGMDETGELLQSLAESGQYDEALIRQALSDDPENKELQEQLERILQDKKLQNTERAEKEAESFSDEQAAFERQLDGEETSGSEAALKRETEGKSEEAKQTKQQVAQLVREGRQALAKGRQAAVRSQDAKIGIREKQKAKQQAVQEAEVAKKKASEALKLDGDSADAKKLLQQATAAQQNYRNLKLEDAEKAEKAEVAKQQAAKQQAAKQQAAKQQAAAKAKQAAAKQQATERQKKGKGLAQLRQELDKARTRDDKAAVDKLVRDILDKDSGDELANTAKARRIEEQNPKALKEAESAYRKALTRDPAQAEALAGLAQNLGKQGRLKEALKAYNDALNKPEQPFDKELWYMRGILLYRLAQYKESVSSFESYLKKGGKNLRVHYGLGLSAERLGRRAQAMVAYQKALSGGLEHAPTRWSLAKLQLQDGKLQEALRNVDAALKLEANDGRYLQTKAEVLFAMKRYREAAASYVRADTAGVSAEEQGNVRYNLGLSYYNNKQYIQAEAAFRKAIATDASKPEYLLGLANTQIAVGKLREVEQTLATGTKKFPNSAALLQTQGNVFLNQKKYELALSSLQKAYKQKPKDRIITNNLGLAYLKLERFGESRDFFRKAIQGDSSNSTLWFNLALVDIASERHLDAVTSLEQVITLDTKMSEAYYFLTREYVVVGRRADAEKTLDRLRRIAPRYVKIVELERLLK